MDLTVSYALFVGADNATGMIDTERIGRIVAKHHSGYTLIPAQGHWQDTDESSVMIIIADDAASVRDTARTLKTELHQDAIGIQQLPPIEYV